MVNDGQKDLWSSWNGHRARGSIGRLSCFLRVYKMCCSDGLRLIGGEKEGEAGLDDEVL